MSRAAVEEILARAIEDDIFRDHLLEAPALALEGYDLSAPERDALILGDLRKVLLTFECSDPHSIPSPSAAAAR